MKCPFKISKAIKSTAYTISEKYKPVKDVHEVNIEESFTDCLKWDCPFYKFISSSDSIGNEAVYEKCSRS